jgi:thioesterase domain-containing protein
VVAREGERGDRRLVAYVVGRNRSIPTAKQLRERLRSRLPEYMVPADYVVLERLPLTSNGKLDRGSLPSPNDTESKAAEEPVAPRTSIESRLARIWERCLAIPRVGVTDNFFGLGGSSLSALQVVSLMNKELGIDFSVAVLFQNPTIEGLCRIALDGLDEAWALSSQVIPLHSETANNSSNAPVFYVHPVGGLASCYTELGRLLGATNRFYGLQSPGIESNQRGASWSVGSIESLASRYIQVIQMIDPEGPYHLGGWSFGAIVAFEIATQLQQLGNEVCSLVLLDPFFQHLRNEVPLELNADTFAGEVFDDAEMLTQLFFNGERLSLPKGTAEERLAVVFEQAKSNNLVPPEADVSYARQIAALVRAHTAAAGRYRPLRYSGHITVFRPVDSATGQSELSDEGLQTIAENGVETYSVPGNHLTMIHSDGAAAIAAWYLRKFPHPIDPEYAHSSAERTPRVVR